jgi:hypothetical protein
MKYSSYEIQDAKNGDPERHDEVREKVGFN